MPSEVTIQAEPIDRLSEVLDDDAASRLHDSARTFAKELAGREVWHVNSTATGGGVAEMLRPLVAYSRGAGVDARWMVIDGDPTFFGITKRIHNGLHGRPGSSGELGSVEHDHFDRVTADNFAELRARIRPGDVVICHDPQTAGLVPLLVKVGALVIWRCHVGTDVRNEWTGRAWRFLEPVASAHRIVFSRDVYIPEHLRDRAVVIAPSIDPLTPKNCDLEPDAVRAALGHVGLLRVPDVVGPTFRRVDGTPGRIDRFADLVQAGPSPSPDVPVVAQISRWDRLKDMVGVMEAFAEHVDGGLDARLVLAGPNVSGVADDPEGAEVLTECIDRWRNLPHETRSRVQLACLPMADPEENAIIVNALQRHATVVVQKSYEEGFGLTVSEAMWKGRPVVASRVGGIQDQVVDGECGVLVDPADHEAFGSALRALLEDQDRAEELGRRARERVRSRFLVDRHLCEHAALLAEVIAS